MQEGVSPVKPTQIYSDEPFKGLAVEMTDAKSQWLPPFTRLPLAAPKPTVSFLFLPRGNSQLQKFVRLFYAQDSLELPEQQALRLLSPHLSMGIKEKISLLASKPRVRELLIA